MLMKRRLGNLMGVRDCNYESIVMDTGYEQRKGCMARVNSRSSWNTEKRPFFDHYGDAPCEQKYE